MKNIKGKIGIAILTHNRPDVYANTLAQIKATLPKGAKLVVVDDASEVPQAGATFRFDTNVGIATGKNKCLELLDDCEHIFLFDDDCFPRVKGWEIPYIESPEPHLMYLFKDLRAAKLHDAWYMYEDGVHNALSHPRGCMLYFHRSVLDIAGGMDTRYEKWGNEHGDLSNRIYNLGLTSFPYMDVANSKTLIYSGDEDQRVRTTVKTAERRQYLAATAERYEASKTSTEYLPYKKGAKRQQMTANGKSKAVLCAFFNGHIDKQRGRRWDADYKEIDALRKSVNAHGHKLVIINNCFDKTKDTPLIEHVSAAQGASPYFQRWLAYWQYLRVHPEIGQVFVTDATDVEMLHDPFPRMEKGVLYIGDEPNKLGCQWMRQTARHVPLKQFVADNFKLPLLNCGVVGGSREDVMRLCRLVYERMFRYYRKETTEMPTFNEVLYTGLYGGKFEHGRKVTTVFKKYETKSPAWFKHK